MASKIKWQRVEDGKQFSVDRRFQILRFSDQTKPGRPGNKGRPFVFCIFDSREWVHEKRETLAAAHRWCESQVAPAEGCREAIRTFDRTCDRCENPFPNNRFPGFVSEHVEGWFHSEACKLSAEHEELTPRREAIVTGGLSATIEKVRQYLPSNYSVFHRDGEIVIAGKDDHGYTLDGYVIPRLGSGLIVAVEVTPAQP